MPDAAVIDAAKPATAHLRYRVSGMDCPSCAGKIETALRRLDGTDQIRINFHTQVLVVSLDEAATPRDRLEASVRRLGFDIAPAEIRAAGLDQAAAAGTSGADPDWRAWLRMPKVRLALAIGLLLIAGLTLGRVLPAAGNWAGQVPWAGHWEVHWALRWACLPAALLGLAFFGRRAIALARAGSPFSIEMLMSVAALGAILIGATAEAAAVVFLFAIGELLEGVAAGRARAGIRALESLLPRTALLVADGSARPVPAGSLRPGDLVLVRPGDRVPADGTIAEGESELDESPITGESIPVLRREGDPVVAGSINASGALQVRVTRAAADNTIARIIRMVEDAQASKAPTERFIERFSRIYTPAAVGIAASVAVLPPLAFGLPWEIWLYRALALLLIACPCALILSTPAAIASGLAAGARRGLLVKGGAALESIARVNTAAFDKTGTLTEGRPRVTDLFAATGTERSLLALAAAAENGSSHPVARAILARAAEDGIPLRPARNARAIPGRAVEAVVTGKRIGVGSPRYAADQGKLQAELGERIAAWEGQGKTVVAVVVDGAPAGLIAVRDEPRRDAAAGIRQLQALGVQTVMLSGDNRRTAEAVAASVGLNALAGLLPEDKVREIAALRTRGPVIMVGDGINDAPSLASADVGIAMGGGTDVALETGDAAILHDRVADVAALVRLARATLANIRQNVTVALGLKGVFLVTTIAGVTGLWPAVMADTGATVLVTLNALRLLRVRCGE